MDSTHTGQFYIMTFSYSRRGGPGVVCHPWIPRVLRTSKTPFGQFLLVLRFQWFQPVSTKRQEIVDKYTSKTFEGVSTWELSKWCCVLILQLPRQRGIVQRRFCCRSTYVEWKHTNTFGSIPFVLHFQCFGATVLWTERKYIGNAIQIEFVQTSFSVFTREMSSENKTAVGQVFVVSVLAMSKRNSFQTIFNC